MSKSISLGTVVAPKGSAAPATLEARNQGSNLETKEARNEGTPQPSKEEKKEVAPRRRAWDGQDEWIKVNFEVPKRLRTKLKELKNWERIGSLKDFVAHALEVAADKEIAKAEKEGF